MLVLGTALGWLFLESLAKLTRVWGPNTEKMEPNTEKKELNTERKFPIFYGNLLRKNKKTDTEKKEANTEKKEDFTKSVGKVS